jgi:dTDP-4-dehydrorhamnose reductase
MTDPHTGEVCVLTDALVKFEDWVGDPPKDKYLPDGYFRTGDLGRLCPATGRLDLLGRLSNAVKLSTGVFFCPEELEKVLVPGVPGLEAASVTVDAEGKVGVYITPSCPDSDQDWLQAISRAARRARLPVPVWVRVKGLEHLLGAYKPKRVETAKQMVARLLGLAPDDIEMDTPLRNLGLDSLASVQVADCVGSSYVDVLAATMRTVETLERGVGSGGAADPTPTPTPPTPTPIPDPEAPVLSPLVPLRWHNPSSLEPPIFHSVFVTGGTGFIGRAVVSCLLKHPKVAQVWCLVRNSSKVPAQWKKVPAGRLMCVVGDVAAPNMGLPTNMGGIPETFTAVIHAAADVKAYDLPAGAALLRPTNVQGTANVLAFAAQRGVRAFVNVSTTSVDYPASNAYAATKAEAEDLVKASEGPTLSVRVPLVLGDNAEDWLHRLADACRDLQARPASDFLWKQQVSTCTLDDCAKDLVRFACSGWTLPYKHTYMSSTSVYVKDLLQAYFPAIVADFPAVNDIAWVHGAKAGTRFSPLA